MKLLSLTARNTLSNLVINQIDFEDFSLLVGASGVGKTQILNAISNLVKIAKGIPVGNFEWSLNFQIEDKLYNWSGQTSKVKDTSTQSRIFNGFIIGASEESKPSFIKESLLENGQEIIRREDEAFYFLGEKIVKLSTTESVVSTLKEEPLISGVSSAFSNMIFGGNANTGFYPQFIGLKKGVLNSFDDFTSLRNSNLHSSAKLFVCQEHFPSQFSEILNSYQDVFPFVDDVEVEKIVAHWGVEDEETLHFAVKIKERGIDDWILQNDISSGMAKSWNQLAQLYLASDGSVFLVDEFENGFGVNCINEVTRALMTCGRQMQFIVTSHHPYIINSIPVSYWKIISRKSATIRNHNPDEFSLMTSNHEAFTKLINLDVYRDGADQ
ncbi:AAA family ATPase [Enterobacter roggenkampii]|uniref:AAA family ATPase n=1 Tax=Enterobacter roggenkampii TaxID=1812935 RepID=UPI0030363DDE|nr:ATP-binding protein [Enterobacter roggenkampii]